MSWIKTWFFPIVPLLLSPLQETGTSLETDSDAYLASGTKEMARRRPGAWRLQLPVLYGGGP